MLSKSIAVGLAVLAWAPSSHAADLIVNPNLPGAFQTIQAAINAAQPGDRILVQASVFNNGFTIDKSVVIQSDTGPRVSVVVDGQVHVQSLTPGLPLILRRINLSFADTFRGTNGFTSNALNGNVTLDEVDIDMGGGATQFGTFTLFSLRANRVWLRACNLSVGDLLPDNGCLGAPTHGANCADIQATTLIMEDCSLRAASANHLFYPTFGCLLSETPFGGFGGAALVARTSLTILVRTSLSDGNGGTVEPNPGWTVTPTAGQTRASSPGGQLDAYAMSHERGQPGRIGAPYSVAGAAAPRGMVSSLGAPAPLSMSGPLAIGGPYSVTVQSAPGEFVFLVAGVTWQRAATVIGPLHTDPLAVFSHPGRGIAATFGIPNLPQLRNVPLVFHSVKLLPLLEIHNPSGFTIR